MGGDATALGRAALHPALRDPFEVMPASPPANLDAAQPAEPPSAPPAPPPPPSPPPLNLVFSGAVRNVSGGLDVYALFNSDPVALTPGTVLPNGYRVDKVTAQSVELLHPQFNVSAVLTIPPAPAFEVR